LRSVISVSRHLTSPTTSTRLPETTDPVRVIGRFFYGFAIGADSDASFLRLEQAQMVHDALRPHPETLPT